ncbi:MAG: hemerythrin family protein [Anaeromyxobacter sp.]
MSWRPELLTGDDTIDAQHRALLEGVERFFAVLASGDREAARAGLAALHAAFLEHTAHEEHLMAVARYPLAVTHKAGHASVFRQVRWLEAEIEVGEGVEQLIATARRLLSDYIEQHVAGTDRALVTWISRRRGDAIRKVG